MGLKDHLQFLSEHRLNGASQEWLLSGSSKNSSIMISPLVVMIGYALLLETS